MSDTLLKKTLSTAEKLGAVDSEVVMTTSTSLGIEVCKGEVETLSLSESVGIGVRVFSPDHRMGFAYTTNLVDGPDKVVDAAWQNALANDPDEFNVLLDEATESDDDWSQEDFSQVPVDRKIAFARELEQKTLDADECLDFVETSSYSDSRGEFIIMNSKGLHRTFRSSACSCSVLGIASSGDSDSDSEMASEFDYVRKFDDLKLDWVATRCAEKAVAKLGGKTCPTVQIPVILNNNVTTQFLQVIGPSLKANNVLKGKSLFAGKCGETIASEVLSFIDQNDYEPGMHYSPFDGEGASARRTVLIEDGMLKEYLHNTYTAKKMGERTTANASRGGFRSTPGVGATNFYLKAGDIDRDGLFAKAGNGLLITKAMGIHMANTISGDFSFGVEGTLIENGILTTPVRGVTVAGNIKDLLKNIAAIGDDLRFFGTYGAPSVLVSELMISGE